MEKYPVFLDLRHYIIKKSLKENFQMFKLDLEKAE